ncbi:MAG TPA: DoxX family protein [Ottowia sp.]|uniref:DoxX family protein n=1 Tax=Ottowia sp. TaxID=1898956 RepID=UPI002BE0989C|nr:DoxX family protein [Ottowia sp.]HMN20174.1 DoxX family protein [Ottowia sp.]
MPNSTADDLGKLVLRLTLGILLLLHGIAKLRYGVDWLEGPLKARGLPAFVSYGVYAGEVLAPVLIILGLFSRVGALLAIVSMLFAIGLMHMDHLWAIGKTGGWELELQGFYLLMSVVLLLQGAGRFSLGGVSGRWN